MKKKLKLARETVRALTDARLHAVAGGAFSDFCSSGCAPPTVNGAGCLPSAGHHCTE